METTEAPISVSVTIYYRGVSMMITKRNSSIKIQPLVEEQMKLIDWMLDEKQAKPSWNSETNKEVLGEQKKTIHGEEGQANTNTDWLEKPVEGKMCPIHPGKELKARTGQYGTFYSHWLGKNMSGKSMYCNGKVK